MINPKLKEGDRVVVLHMDDDISPIPMGTAGTVLKHSIVFGDDQYAINWDNGSRLSLINGVDMWDFEENYKHKRKKKITEMNIDSFKKVISGNNADVFKYFNAKFLRKYLLTLRDSGITNMFGASPYLYIGRERLEHEFKYKDIPNEEKFDELLDMADQAQSEMVHGIIKYLEANGKEADLQQINRELRRFSSAVVQNYMLLF
jgi:hypothetical protein